VRDRGLHERRLADRREVDPVRAVGELRDRLLGDPEREPRLARPAGADEGQQPMAEHERARLGQLGLAADERRRRRGQVRLAQGGERREGGVPGLVDPHRLGEILEAVLAEVAYGRVVGQQRSRRGREQHLAAVPRRGDASGLMQVEADVLAVDDRRRAAVEPHAHADRAAGERPLSVERRGERVARRGEREEERVALRAQLHAVPHGERIAEATPMLCQRARVGVPQLADERGRPLDVGEEQGDRSAWQLAHDRLPLERLRPHERGPLEHRRPIVARDGGAEARDRLVRPHLDRLDCRGDRVARAHRRGEAPVDVQEDAPRARQILGHDRVQETGGDAALHDQTAETAPGGGRLVVVERVAVARELGEELDVAARDLPRARGGVADAGHGSIIAHRRRSARECHRRDTHCVAQASDAPAGRA
jgi:hypothetical protein